MLPVDCRKHFLKNKIQGDRQMEKRLRTVLYNAISLLIDETFEQYDDSEEWFAMLQNELACTKEELEELGIKITVDGDCSQVQE